MRRRSSDLSVHHDPQNDQSKLTPLTSRNKRELTRANHVLHAYLSDRGLTPSTKCCTMNAPEASKRFCAASFKFQLVPSYLHRTYATE